ncbi:MAG TPA: hemerythrin domain-containing protein [Chloroflexia bacterium]|nr:hemerythrin domain-containing protein [Chloroflexia bacterium]
MKRDPALRGLSHDHHHGLVQAHRLMRAATPEPAGRDGTPAEVARAFLAFWAAGTTRHFRVEEEVLLPGFARYADPDQPPIVRMLLEHVHIRRLAGDLAAELAAGPPTPATLAALGTLLEAHIRHEEGVVFPLIEAAMPPDGLATLAAALHAAELPATAG